MFCLCTYMFCESVLWSSLSVFVVCLSVGSGTKASASLCLKVVLTVVIILYYLSVSQRNFMYLNFNDVYTLYTHVFNFNVNIAGITVHGSVYVLGLYTCWLWKLMAIQTYVVRSTAALESIIAFEKHQFLVRLWKEDITFYPQMLNVK